jgi:hypothetical protein
MIYLTKKFSGAKHPLERWVRKGIFMKENQLAHYQHLTCQQQLGRIEFAPEPSTVFCFCQCALFQAKKMHQDSQMNNKEEIFDRGKNKNNPQTMREALEEAFYGKERHNDGS